MAEWWNADTHVLDACAERREGSNPFLVTKSNKMNVRITVNYAIKINIRKLNSTEKLINIAKNNNTVSSSNV